MEDGKSVPEPEAPEMERIEEDYKPLSMWISEFKERPFEALAFASGAAFVMALLFLSTGK